MHWLSAARMFTQAVFLARRAAIRMALFGESGGDALQMVNALNEGIEKLVPVVDADMVAAGDKAIEMWGRFKNVVMATTNEAMRVW